MIEKIEFIIIFIYYFFYQCKKNNKNLGRIDGNDEIDCFLYEMFCLYILCRHFVDFVVDEPIVS